MVKSPYWSIVIPTLNEGNYLPNLLESIRKQDFKDYEIIVADSYSDDDTVKIAKKYGCRVLNGVRGNPGINRNMGARIANGKNIIFFDADVVLPKGFLRTNTQFFRRHNLDVAGNIGIPLNGTNLDRAIRFVANNGIKILKYVKPSVEGYFIFVKKKVHDKEEFDESITFAEDSEYVERIYRHGGKFGLLKMPIFVSMRRFEKKGKIKMSAVYIWLTFRRFFTEMKKKDIDYEFGKF